MVQKNEQFNFSIEFFGFKENVTLHFDDSTIIYILNQNGLESVNRILINKTFARLGLYKIFAHDLFYEFNSTCLIQLDGSKLDLSDVNSIVYLLDKKIDLNDCLNNCSGNGICKQSTDDKYKCVCLEDYEGITCQLNKHKCIKKPCLNNGNCTETKVYSNFTGSFNYEFNCTCPERYDGTYCEKMKKNICADVSCSGNGVCFYNQNLETEECRCFSYYSGKNCETESDQMKTIKKVITTATIIAIIIIVLLFSIFIIFDVISIFINRKNKVSPKKKEVIFKPVYISQKNMDTFLK